MNESERKSSGAAANDEGVALYAAGKLGEAAGAFLSAVQIDGENIQAQSNLGLVLRDLGRADEAVALLQQALRQSPGHPILYNNLALAFEDEGLLEQAIACYQRSLDERPDQPYVHSNLLLALNYDPTQTPHGLLAEHYRWAGRFAHRIAAAHPNVPDAGRKLRIGYVSPDFRAHPAVYFFEPILMRHDRAHFEVFGYANVICADAVTTRLRGHCNQFRLVHAMNDSQLAQLVRDDRIDILVDLAGHTGHHRLTMFARKPAPVQVTYLGYQNTTGLDSIDYRITDDVTDPPGEKGHLSEQPLRLPCGFLCFQPAPTAPALSLLPAQQGGRITFGVNHRLMKVNAGVLDVWAKVLKALPQARLVMFPRSLTRPSMQRTIEAMAQRGIDEHRVTFHHRLLTGRRYLDVFEEVDLMLDAQPTCAGTTACESLWMGVPLITKRGNRFSGRMAASILTRLDLKEFIAENDEQYVRLAVDWAGRIDELSRLRSTMRTRMLGSPLCDASGFVTALEQAYRRIWSTWCAMHRPV